MFDFFGEIIEFLSQVAYWGNWAIGFITDFVSASASSVSAVSSMFSGLDARIVWIIPASFTVLIFDFVRGR